MVHKLSVFLSVIFILLVSGCLSSPNPVILSKNAEETLQGLNWVTVITTDIENRGDSGNVLVTVEVKVPNGNSITQKQTVSIEKGLVKRVSFTFDTKFGDKMYYTVTASPE